MFQIHRAGKTESIVFGIFLFLTAHRTLADKATGEGMKQLDPSLTVTFLEQV